MFLIFKLKDGSQEVVNTSHITSLTPNYGEKWAVWVAGRDEPVVVVDDINDIVVALRAKTPKDARPERRARQWRGGTPGAVGKAKKPAASTATPTTSADDLEDYA
jgi:hypothetical protein